MADASTLFGDRTDDFPAASLHSLQVDAMDASVVAEDAPLSEAPSESPADAAFSVSEPERMSEDVALGDEPDPAGNDDETLDIDSSVESLAGVSASMAVSAFAIAAAIAGALPNAVPEMADAPPAPEETSEPFAPPVQDLIGEAPQERVEETAPMPEPTEGEAPREPEPEQPQLEEPQPTESIETAQQQPQPQQQQQQQQQQPLTQASLASLSAETTSAPTRSPEPEVAIVTRTSRASSVAASNSAQQEAIIETVFNQTAAVPFLPPARSQPPTALLEPSQEAAFVSSLWPRGISKSGVPRPPSILHPNEFSIVDPTDEGLGALLRRQLGQALASRRAARAEPPPNERAHTLEQVIQHLTTGRFRAAAFLARDLLLSDPPPTAVEAFQLFLCRQIGLVRARLYQAANHEVAMAGDLCDVERWPSSFPRGHPLFGRGFPVPFALRLLAAELPHYTGYSAEATAQLSAVLNGVRRVRHALANDSTLRSALSDPTACDALWQKREVTATVLLANQQLRSKDVCGALRLMERLALQRPDDMQILSALGRLNLTIGNLEGAREIFNVVRTTLGQTTGGAIDRDVLILSNNALLATATGLFSHAEHRLKDMLAQNQLNIAALNNLAVAYLYNGMIAEAVRTLDKAVGTFPPLLLCETLVENMCHLYDLESDRDRAAEKKRELLRRLATLDGDLVLPPELAAAMS